MRKKDVEVGTTYHARVSKRWCRVKILRALPYGGWSARNMETGREISIRSAGRLHASLPVGAGR